ncbi:MAG: choice-of-anchor L domain-containing protein [Bacteroidota bacterium]
MRHIVLLFLFFSLFSPFYCSSQVNITGFQTAAALAQKLVGPGVTVSNPTLTCPSIANGIFSVVSSNLGLDSGIILTTGWAATSGAGYGANGPQSTGGNNANASHNNNAPGDPQLTSLAGQNTYDACSLQFDVIPSGDTLEFQYVFGSEEYINSVCAQYNDVFAFFISGPGISGQQNIALVPGTNVPVAVNSINNGVPGINSNGTLSACNAMGPGSPFTNYYVNNVTGTTITYYGFTNVLSAIKAVTPCSTYHLKLAIADAGNGTYDSGVFIAAGSLKTKTFTIQAVGLGVTEPYYCVKGCNPAHFVIKSSQVLSTPQVINYSIGGNALNGVDYSFLSGTAIIPANDSQVIITINGLVTTPTGPKTVTLSIQSSCSLTGSASIVIYDPPFVNILTPDTSICTGNNLQLQVNSTNGLFYQWSPTTGLNNANIQNPIASPTVNTTYVVTAIWPGTGCASVSDSIHITIHTIPAVSIITNDTAICLGNSIPISVNGSNTMTYSWSPVAGLSDPNVQDPTATPTATTTYVVSASLPGSGCAPITDTITVTVKSLPHAVIFTPDTSVCMGKQVQINAIGNPAFVYSWVPSTGVSNPNIVNPMITTTTSTTYTLLVSNPGCGDSAYHIAINIIPPPSVYIAPGRRVLCSKDTVHLHAIVSPAGYPYTFNWSPPYGLDFSNVPDPIFTGTYSSSFMVTVSGVGGCNASDTTSITVVSANFLGLDNTTICPYDTLQLHVASNNINSISWTPNQYISDTSIADPFIWPPIPFAYTINATDINGCKENISIQISVVSEAIINLPDSVTIFPGDTYHISPTGNCSYFSWSPTIGLTGSDISDPIVSPDINTRYYVHGITSAGCKTEDSIYVKVAPDSYIDVPNVFTPGTGPNSALRVVHNGLATLKLFTIYNRWGNKVFETADINEGWNGHYKGDPQPMGVYVYVVDAFFATGKPFHKQGNITLIR